MKQAKSQPHTNTFNQQNSSTNYDSNFDSLNVQGMTLNYSPTNVNQKSSGTNDKSKANLGSYLAKHNQQ